MKPGRKSKAKKALLKSSNSLPKNASLFIYAPPKTGKTEMAATASEFWPGHPESGKFKKVVKLDDMAWILFDAGGLDSLRALNIEVPKLVTFWDAAEMYPDNMEAALLALVDTVAEVDAGYIVVDTISMADRYIFAEADRLSGGSGFDKFRAGLTWHTRFYTELSLLGLPIIYLGHAKAPVEVDGNTTRKKAMQAIMAPIIPDLTGQARTLYIGNCSLHGALTVRESRVGGKLNRKRVFLPLGGQGFEGGSRWEGLLEAEEEPDVKKLFGKVFGS